MNDGDGGDDDGDGSGWCVDVRNLKPLCSNSPKNRKQIVFIGGEREETVHESELSNRCVIVRRVLFNFIRNRKTQTAHNFIIYYIL